MKKQTVAASLFVLITGILLVGALWLSAPRVVESPVEDGVAKEVAEVATVVKEFMEGAYIKNNSQEVSGLYIPPQGFETFLSEEPFTAEEYIEWYVKSVDLQSHGRVTSVQIRDVEIITDQEQVSETPLEELYKVTFYFMKDNGEPVYFGPCCGEEGLPSADMFTRVQKINDGYKIFEDLPYRP